MAKRRIRAAELAGLAALGAFGHTFFGPGRDRKPGERPASEVPVDYLGTDRQPTVRGDMSSADLYADAALAQQPEIREHVFDAPMGVRENVFDPGAVPAPVRRPAAAAGQGASAGPSAGIRSLINDREHVFDAPMRPAARRALINDRENVFDPRAAGPLTREEAISSIPGQSARAPQDGERVSGNEFTRNVGNILNAPVPGFIPVGRAVRGGTVLRQAPDAVPALPAPQARLAGPSRGALKEAERTARQERLREQVRRENAANYGLDPNAPGYAAAVRALTRDLGGKDFTLKKKGGAVKAKPKKMASGGMSSASKRGDGIASKGKTKCKMY